MYNYRFSGVSEKNMIGVHPTLIKVIQRALQLSVVDFKVLEGLRTLTRQKQLVAAKASWTMNSRHLTGHAMDLGAIVGGKVSWDWPLYIQIANAVQQAAIELNVNVRWGGSWKNLRDMKSPITAAMLSKSKPDGPHYELDPKEYPL